MPAFIPVHLIECVFTIASLTPLHRFSNITSECSQRSNTCGNIWTPVRELRWRTAVFNGQVIFFFNVEHANGRAMSFCAWVPSSCPRGWARCSGSGGCLPPGLFPLWLVSLPPNKGTSFNSPSLLSTHPTYLLFPDLTLPTICPAYRHKVALLMLPRWFERGQRVMFRDSHSIQETITSLECPLVTDSFTLSVWRSGFRGFLPPAVRLYNQSL